MKEGARSSLGDLVRLGAPLVAGMGGHALFNIVDLAMVGAYHGPKAEGPLAETLAAVGVASVVVTIPLVFMNGISNGTVTVIARYFAAGKTRRANACAHQAMLLAGVFSIVLGVLPAFFSAEIATAFGMRPGTYAHTLTCDYLSLLNFHAWSGFVLLQVTANMRAVGMGMWTMALLLVSNVGNIVGNVLLVFGNWGAPELGPMGAAWATVIARGVAAIAGLALSLNAHPAIRLFPGNWRPRARFVWKITHSAVPVALQWTVRMAAITAVMLVIVPFGESEKAAFSVGTRLDTLALFAGLGWGAACAAMVSHGIGRGSTEEVKSVAAKCAVLNVTMMSAAGVLYYAFAEELVRLFSLGGGERLSPADVEAGARYLRIAVFAYPGLALSVVWSHALNGAGSLKTPLLLDVVGLLVVQVPLASWLSRTGWGVGGAWWAVVISHSLLAIVYGLVFRGGAWERKRLR